jgi:hypothetical protein
MSSDVVAPSTGTRHLHRRLDYYTKLCCTSFINPTYQELPAYDQYQRERKELISDTPSEEVSDH